MTSPSMKVDVETESSTANELNLKADSLYKSKKPIINFFNSIQMRLAEGYIGGSEVPDSFLKNIAKAVISIVYRYYTYLFITDEWILTESEAIAEESEELMKLQYDLPKKMFRLMLDEDDLLYPKYTMALWEKGATNLREAQLNMLEDVITKANIHDGDSILDLGCGWGSAANYILDKFPNAKVTALNLSHEQCNYIRGKIQDSKSHLSSERFTLIEGDFNEVDFDSKFDKIILIGLFEHIGNLTQSLKKISSFLKADGQVFVHIISINFPHNMWNPFLDKYIFPRARVWHSQMIPSCDRDLKTVDQWFINGSNYSQTLQVWLKNFDRHQEQIKNLNYGMNYPRFRRMWRLYLLLCIAHFDAGDGKILGNAQYKMVHS